MAMKYLVRFHSGHTHGWQFRYALDGNWANPETKFFPDKRCGSSIKALKAARAYRNKFLKAHDLYYLLKGRAKKGVVKNHIHNTSGIVGVCLSVTYKKEYEYFAWRGQGMINSRIWVKTFSIDKYTERVAFIKACAERYKRHGVLHINCNIKDLPCNPGVPYKKV